jgi:hypothetical protein
LRDTFAESVKATDRLAKVNVGFAAIAVPVLLIRQHCKNTDEYRRNAKSQSTGKTNIPVAMM